jgi:hypothetical protein
VADDEIAGRVVGAPEGEPDPCLLGSAAAQRRGGEHWQREHPVAGVRFRSLHLELAADDARRPAHAHGARVEVDVGPAQREQLAAAAAQRQPERGEHGKPCGRRGDRGEQAPRRRGFIQPPSRWVGYCIRCAHKQELARQRELRRQARANRPCQGCGQRFTGARSDARYCSGACRQKAYRQRGGS